MMTTRRITHRRITHRQIALGLLAAAATLIPTACSDDPTVKLSANGALGKEVSANVGCMACHSTTGSELVGPSWKGLMGETVTLKGGDEITIDADYLKRAVRDPNAERRDDAKGQMPVFDESRLSDEELDQVVAYIDDLSKASASGS